MRKVLFIVYYTLLGVSVLLAVLWLTDKTSVLGLEKSSGLQYTIMGMALLGMVLGQVLRRQARQEE
ncbi:MAG: hypothetical protein ACOYOD_13915 [Saprospiraceae bacterium]|jgi:hypothetical protein